MNDDVPTATASGLRASDADRERTARRLGEALGDGRLDHAEYGERLDSAFTATTMGDLARLTEDLPGGAEAAAAPAPEAAPAGSSVGSENIVAVLASAERTGRWLVEPRTNASNVLGSIELDMREAVLSGPRVVLQCAVLLGSVELVVPPGIRVVSRANAVLGSVDTAGAAPAGPDAPTVEITGLVLLGSVSVTTRGPGAQD
ncbi:DUF1707 SHOCT-like domain-containing protein [Nocardiopsis suaedae]|uniref:DUF1707 domain-containing protein n=1 Tax=Nocardiopsis suaedae TaxID=3018444 RepID=A0ABT4TNX2_9ACTN|nr:DUF1707 domain-containing protein [Nocardiopsis suaedae]MDA2806380.1 DUF1707 domain-containing protein [Nocardiopsis suaedae]